MKKLLIVILTVAFQLIFGWGCAAAVPRTVPTTVFTPTKIPYVEDTPRPVLPTSTLAPTRTLIPSRTPTLTPTITPTVTNTASPGDPQTRFGPPVWRDTMENDDYWPREIDEFTNLNVVNGVMRLTGMSQKGGWRLATTPRLKNFYIEMTATPEKCIDKDYYGIFFRSPVIKEADQGYLFGVSCDGHYALKKWDGKVEPDGQTTTLINWTAHPAIVPGPGMTNRIGVLAQETELAFYVNGSYLQSSYDESYPAGYIGVLVKPDRTEKFTVLIDNFAYWTQLY